MSERDIYLNENRPIFEECQDLHARVAELEAALRELLGSYRSLAVGAKARGWVGSDFEQWDGPSMARSALGEKGKENA